MPGFDTCPQTKLQKDEKWTEAAGHELRGLIRMASEQEAEPVAGPREDRAHYSRYRKMPGRALRKHAG
jgi:hypothetical protein